MLNILLKYRPYREKCFDVLRTLEQNGVIYFILFQS